VASAVPGRLARILIGTIWVGAEEPTILGDELEEERQQMSDYSEREKNHGLRFAGGDVAIPKPTRADLILSAQQWVTRAREELHDIEVSPFQMDGRRVRGGGISGLRHSAIMSALDHVTRTLKELEAAK
jgi:hypothetical protein